MISVHKLPQKDGVVRYAEIRRWTKECCKGSYSLTKTFGCIEFSLEEDAMAFKLRWL